MSASWEMVAHVLSREVVCDTALAARLDCPPGFVARVRSDLGMPSFPIPEPLTRCEKPVREAQREKFERLTVAVEDHHREWLGRHTRDGTPIFAAGLTAYRIAFRLEHGEEPNGLVRVECGHLKCVEGRHLSDRLIRDRAAYERAAAGL